MRLRQSLQRLPRTAVFRVRRNLLLFSSRELLQRRTTRAKTELAIKPEGSRIERLVILLSDLVRINRDRRRPRERAKTTQHLRIDPRGLALAIRVESVEADFDPLAQTDRLDVVDGNTILECESRDIRAQRQAPRRNQIPEVHHDAAIKRRTHHRTGIPERGSV